MSSTMALNNMLSPSEMVRRIERARFPTSKSSYNQSSAFQMGISLCWAGSTLGLFTGSPSERSGNPPRRNTLSSVAGVEPLDQFLIGQVSTQTAIDLDAGSFEKAHKSIETRAHIGILQSLKRLGKETTGSGIDRRISPGCQTGWLSAFFE